eukprot:TRINITY_DN1074_c0_g1_i1.p1 TRINITY_DN1074_c0_g1~~TRINITY_DN1074_c0_g1_i1.p1  ORF type:complete len:345 (+),score=129.62 TRINITY_DN1074_c0_g1_i1:41-1075(+)
MSQQVDLVRSVRNYFYMGLHKNVMKEAKALRDKTPQADVLYYRSLIACGHAKQVIQDIPTNASVDLQAIKQYAAFTLANEDNRDLLLEQLKTLTNPSLTQLLMAATMFFEAKNYNEALKLIHKTKDNLELLALTVQIYLKIDRFDLAQKQLKIMQEIDDDDTLSVLAGSWVNIALGGDKIQEASSFLQELTEKFEPSISVLNSLAVCAIEQKNYTVGFQLLSKSRKLALESQDPVSPDTLVNTIVCLQHLKKSQDIINKIIGDLKQTAPNHWWLKQYAAMDALFDQNAASYKPAASSTAIVVPSSSSATTSSSSTSSSSSSPLSPASSLALSPSSSSSSISSRS